MSATPIPGALTRILFAELSASRPTVGLRGVGKGHRLRLEKAQFVEDEQVEPPDLFLQPRPRTAFTRFEQIGEQRDGVRKAHALFLRACGEPECAGHGVLPVAHPRGEAQVDSGHALASVSGRLPATRLETRRRQSTEASL